MPFDRYVTLTCHDLSIITVTIVILILKEVWAWVGPNSFTAGLLLLLWGTFIELYSAVTVNSFKVSSLSQDINTKSSLHVIVYELVSSQAMNRYKQTVV